MNMLLNFQSLFQVRLADHSDINDILNITKEAFKKYSEMCGTDKLAALSETYDDVKYDIDNKIVLIALSDGLPVGCARIEIFEDKTAYLSRFAVKTDSQNNGIGKSIMNLADKIMIKNGIKSLSLHTGSKITPLIRFYYGRGFYIKSTETVNGYLRALLVKDYSA